MVDTKDLQCDRMVDTKDLQCDGMVDTKDLQCDEKVDTKDLHIYVGPWGKYCVQCYRIPLSAEQQLKVNGRDVDIDLNKPGFKLRCSQHTETIHFVFSIPERL